MSLFRNSGSETIYFRDDSPEKREIAPGESFDVVGDQHVEHVLTLPGVEYASADELRETAEAAGVSVPKRARKADLVATVRDMPEAPDEP